MAVAAIAVFRIEHYPVALAQPAICGPHNCRAPAVIRNERIAGFALLAARARYQRFALLAARARYQRGSRGCPSPIMGWSGRAPAPPATNLARGLSRSIESRAFLNDR